MQERQVAMQSHGEPKLVADLPQSRKKANRLGK
jgi:hypothetical protein